MKSNVLTKAQSKKKSREKSLGQCLYLDELSGTYFFIKEFGKGETRKKIRERLNARNLREARKEVVDRLDSIAKRMSNRNHSIRSFDETAKRWLLTKSHLRPRARSTVESSVRALIKHFDKIPMKSLSPDLCIEWSNLRKKERSNRTGKPISSSQFNKEYDTLNAILEHAVRLGIIYTNPLSKDLVQKMKPNASHIEIPTREQFEQILQAIRSLGSRNHNAYLLTKLLAYSGARLSEATSLTWADVGITDLEFRNTFRIFNAKRRKNDTQYREIPIFPRLREFLVELRDERNPKPSDRVSLVSSARTTYDRIEPVVGFHVHHHMFRHYFASNAIEAGVDFKTIAHWLNHNDGGILVARTYGHLRQDHSLAMAQLLKS